MTFDTIPEEIFKYASALVKKYIRYYNYDFQCLALDYKDLFQEVSLSILEVVKKYQDKPEEELKKIISGAICNKLNILRLKGKKEQKKLQRYVKQKEISSALENVSNGDTQEKEIVSVNISNPQYPNLALESLKNFCNSLKQKNLFAIFQGRLVENKTFVEIAKELNCHRQRVEFLFHKYLPLLRLYLKESI